MKTECKRKKARNKQTNKQASKSNQRNKVGKINLKERKEEMKYQK